MTELLSTLWKLEIGKTTRIELYERLISAHRYRPSLSLIDITDGCKAGKKAVKASISLPDSYSVEAFETCLEWFSIVLDMVLSNEWPQGKTEIFQTFQGLRCTAYLIKTNGILNERNLKPLAEIPGKWTLRHIARALANKQYIPGSFQCDGRYTDDYAYDASVNFGKGPVSHQRLLEDLIESPSGYHAWVEALEDGALKILVACHHFLYYSFHFRQ